MLERVDQIDFNELYVLLLDASRKAFRGVQEAHPDETFYAFGLYQYNRSFPFFPMCNSEEAHMRLGNLTQAERDNQTLEWFFLRWNYPSWKHHHALGREYFVSVTEWMDDNLKRYTPPRNEEAQDTVWAKLGPKISNVRLKVLKVLDEENLFGEESRRENTVLLSIWGWDDYDEKDNDFHQVRSLNPTSTYERWRFEMERYHYAQEFLSLPVRLRF
jgi:hypothetical protein